MNVGYTNFWRGIGMDQSEINVARYTSIIPEYLLRLDRNNGDRASPCSQTKLLLYNTCIYCQWRGDVGRS